MPHRGKGAELLHVLSAATDKPLVILLNGHPDPDAIGSALAHKRICDHLGVSATIAHALPLSRSENRALVKLLDIPLTRILDSAELRRFGYLSLVDASQSEPTLALPEDIKLLTVVDHHRPPGPVEAPFVDMRPDYGATCTIYAEYFEHGLLPLEPDQKSSVAVATAAFFGILTDTDDFARATAADFRAAAYLKPFTDAEILSRLGRWLLTAEAMDAVGRALTNLEVVRDFALAGVGRLSAQNRDGIAMAADFILRREDIDTVLVYGIVNGRVDGSLRTNRASVDPAAFLLTAFGTDETGRPYGGGRNDKGGFQIPLGVLGDADNDDTLWKVVEQAVRRRVARVVPEIGKVGRA
jgi:nanoRNase/pAp phosphatase (c-di-AMP/oligoRNAs hydrolase)